MPGSPTALLLVPHLNGGGAARVTTNLALGLAQRSYNVHLAIATAAQPGPSFPAGVTVHCLGASRVRWSLPRLVRLIRKLRPDLILSNMAHLNLAVLALRPLLPPSTRLLVRNDGGLRLDRLKPLSRTVWRRLHARADAILCQSVQMADEIAPVLSSRHCIRILPNPVNTDQIHAATTGISHWDGAGPNLLAIGRLVRCKGFDLLLSAFAAVAFRYPTSQLVLLGDGSEATDLQHLARRIGISDRVLFAGQTATPEAWFSGATLYIQPSRQDALPNALLEAAAAGLPLVATPARGAIPDLLRGNPGCWLAAEVSAPALAYAISKALASLTPGQRYPHVWAEQFAMPNAIESYDRAIRAVLST